MMLFKVLFSMMSIPFGAAVLINLAICWVSKSAFDWGGVALVYLLLLILMVTVLPGPDYRE